jgi:ABC-2 type transport system permease protein
MSTQSKVIPESPAEARVAVPVAISAMRLFYWSVRRELWEHRSIYIAPLAATGLFLTGFLIGMVRLPGKMSAAMALDAARQHELITQPYQFVELLLMGTMLIVAAFYCVDALHGERRDRSILFWKSLPVSDATTVLAKAIIPVVILPLLTFAITMATQFVMAMLSTVVLAGTGAGRAILWSHLPLLHMWSMLFGHIFGFHGLWYAPFYGWLLLVSGWARRAAFLWATVPLLAAGFVEKIAFNTSYFGHLLEYRFSGAPERIARIPGNLITEPLSHIGFFQLLSSPGMWTGLALTAVFLAAAVRLRRYREPM